MPLLTLFLRIWSKSKLAKIIQSGEFLGKTLGNLGKKNIIRLCCSFG